MSIRALLPIAPIRGPTSSTAWMRTWKGEGLLRGFRDVADQLGPEDVLGRSISREERIAVERAHAVGEGHYLGRRNLDGTYEKHENADLAYTPLEIALKARILREVGFSQSERRALIEHGVVGNREKEAKRKKWDVTVPEVKLADERKVDEGFMRAALMGASLTRAFEKWDDPDAKAAVILRKCTGNRDISKEDLSRELKVDFHREGDNKYVFKLLFGTVQDAEHEVSVIAKQEKEDAPADIDKEMSVVKELNGRAGAPRFGGQFETVDGSTAYFVEFIPGESLGEIEEEDSSPPTRLRHAKMATKTILDVHSELDGRVFSDMHRYNFVKRSDTDDDVAAPVDFDWTVEHTFPQLFLWIYNSFYHRLPVLEFAYALRDYYGEEGAADHILQVIGAIHNHELTRDRSQDEEIRRRWNEGDYFEPYEHPEYIFAIVGEETLEDIRVELIEAVGSIRTRAPPKARDIEVAVRDESEDAAIAVQTEFDFGPGPQGVLGRSISKEERAAIERAHAVGEGHYLGKQNPDGTYEKHQDPYLAYTPQEIAQKARILQRADFNRAERRALIEHGIVGAKEKETVTDEATVQKVISDTIDAGRRLAGEALTALNIPHVDMVNRDVEDLSSRVPGADRDALRAAGWFHDIAKELVDRTESGDYLDVGKLRNQAKFTDKDVGELADYMGLDKDASGRYLFDSTEMLLAHHVMSARIFKVYTEKTVPEDVRKTERFKQFEKKVENIILSHMGPMGVNTEYEGQNKFMENLARLFVEKIPRIGINKEDWDRLSIDEKIDLAFPRPTNVNEKLFRDIDMLSLMRFRGGMDKVIRFRQGPLWQSEPLIDSLNSAYKSVSDAHGTINENVAKEEKPINETSRMAQEIRSVMDSFVLEARRRIGAGEIETVDDLVAAYDAFESAQVIRPMLIPKKLVSEIEKVKREAEYQAKIDAARKQKEFTPAELTPSRKKDKTTFEDVKRMGLDLEYVDGVDIGGLTFVTRVNYKGRPGILKTSKRDRLVNNNLITEGEIIAYLNPDGSISVLPVFAGFAVNQNGERKGIIVEEFPEGTNLRTRIKSASLSESDAVVLSVKLARLLRDHVHSKGIMHRDIKPANIHILDNGEILLFDFNVSARADYDWKNDPRRIWSSSTEGYAPKDVTSRRTLPSFSDDAFGVGATLYYMRTGTHLPKEYLEEGKELDALEGVHEAIRNIILKATNLNKKERYNDVNELLQDLIEAGKAVVEDSFDRDMFVEDPETGKMIQIPTEELEKIKALARENLLKEMRVEYLAVSERPGPYRAESCMAASIEALHNANNRAGLVLTVAGGVEDAGNQLWKLSKQLSDMLGETGYGQREIRQMLTFDLNDPESYWKAMDAAQRILDKLNERLEYLRSQGSSKEREAEELELVLKNARIVTFAPQNAERNWNLAEAARDKYRMQENVTVIPDSYTDYRVEAGEVRSVPDLLVRSALARLIADYRFTQDKEGAFRNITGFLREITELDLEEMGIETLEGLLNHLFEQPLRISAIWENMAQMREAYREVERSL
ncbi:AarF/UbiB family protein [Candidatus Omnitrophota bacterium]